MFETDWTLATLNINGLRSGVRRGFNKWIRKRRPSVLAMQELRISEDQRGGEHAAPRGWKARYVDAEKRGYSGVSVWSREGWQSERVGCGLDWADQEGRVLRVDYSHATVVSVYVPSGSSGEARQGQKEAFLEHFLGYTGNLLAEGRPTVLCGDFNIAHTKDDIHNPTGNKKNSGFLPHERAWFDRLLEQGWVDVYRALHPDAKHYSWWSNRGRARELDRGWRLDYQIATPDLAAKAIEAKIERKAGLSDHAPVIVRYRQ